MNVWSNVKYYLNYFDLNRGDNKIINYFSSNENYKAIKELTNEGYFQFLNEFNEIVNSYSAIYPLNKQELAFIERIRGSCLSNIKLNINNNYFALEARIKSEKEYLISYKQRKSNLKNEYTLDILDLKTKILKKNIKQIWPISDAVITRRFTKKLLESLIRDNIKRISLENYIPNIQTLKKYKVSMSNNYIYREISQGKGKKKELNKEMELGKIISLMEKAPKEKALEQKNENIKIKYLKEDEEVIKVIKLLFRMKNACNKVIHFNKKFGENLNANDYIQLNFMNNEEKEEESKEEKEGEENINEINTIKENKSIMDKNIPISTVAKFIAFGNSSHKTLKNFEKYDKKLKKKIETIQTKVDNLIEINQLTDYELRKGEIVYIKSIIEEELSKLVINDYELSLSKEEIKILDDYFKNNILNLDDIQSNEINLDIVKIDCVSYFNGLRKGMSVKEKYKFNITFDININLLNLKKEIETLIPLYNKIGIINDDIDKLNVEYEQKLNEIRKEIDDIKITKKFLKREDIFSDLTQDKFIKSLEAKFDKINLDYFEPEINNFHLYIYLLKNNIYDEKSYKSTVGIVEEYIKI